MTSSYDDFSWVFLVVRYSDITHTSLTVDPEAYYRAEVRMVVQHWKVRSGVGVDTSSGIVDCVRTWRL